MKKKVVAENFEDMRERVLQGEFTWEGTQWPDGKDAVATDDDTIQLTMKVIKGKTPDAEKPSKPGSNVVNGRGTVRPAVRERVEAAIKELGYVPNPTASRPRAAS